MSEQSPMSPADFHRLMALAVSTIADQRDAMYAGVRVMIDCLVSNGFGAGVETLDKATKGIRS